MNKDIKSAKTQLRVNQLKVMDEFIHSVNDEELMDDWLSYGVPDETSEDDYRFIAENDDLYMDCVRFLRERHRTTIVTTKEAKHGARIK